MYDPLKNLKQKKSIHFALFESKQLKFVRLFQVFPLTLGYQVPSPGQAQRVPQPGGHGGGELRGRQPHADGYQHDGTHVGRRTGRGSATVSSP